MIYPSQLEKPAFASLGCSDILPGEIPDIDLYMDQVITLFERKLSGNSEKPLTKSMINNYSRENLVRAVKGKKYTREQIIQMLIIYNLKQILGMQEIRVLFDFLEESDTSYETFYKMMLDVKRALMATALDSPEFMAGGALKEENPLKHFLYCTLLSANYKNAAGELIEKMRRNQHEEDRNSSIDRPGTSF